MTTENRQSIEKQGGYANTMMSFVKSAAKNSLVYGLGNISTKIVGFILLPLYTSHLSVQDYGILGLVEVSSQILVSAFGLGLSLALYRWYWDKEFVQQQKSIVFTCMVFLCCVIAVFVAAAIVFASQISSLIFDSPAYAPLIVLLSLSASFQILASIPSSLMQLQQRAVLFSLVNTIQLSVSLIATIVCVAYLDLKVLGIYVAQAIGSVLYFVILTKYILANTTPVFNSSILKGMLSYSLPLAFASISGVIISVADRYMLRYLGTLADVGIYSLGYKIANTLYVFIVMSINLAVSPLVYKVMDDPNNKRMYSKVMTYAGLGVMTCVIAVSFFGREAIKVMAVNPEYWSSYRVIPFISFGIFFGMLRDISMIGLNLTKKTKVISTIIVSISLFNIVLNALFIPHWQTIGASVAALVSQLVFFLLIYVFAQKHYHIPYEQGKIVLITLVGISLVIGGTFVQDAPLAVRLGTKTFLFLMFPVLLYYLNFFESIELQRIHDAWLKWNNPARWRRNISDFLNTSM